MPYIKPVRKEVLQPLVERLAERCYTAGDFTYVIYALAKAVLKPGIFGKDYTNLSGIVGCMECAKTEFYRRIVTPYEDQKIKENGDV